ncbi:MAG: RNA methyltransferase [Clostridiales Family XIII bacterium]|nr:RNA methyltransferase [Clostridiales Family XIII bacterium]
MKHIASGANAAVKRARKLLQKKGRDTDDAFIIEGFILIGDAVRAGVEIERVFVRGAASAGIIETELKELLTSDGEDSGVEPETRSAKSVTETETAKGAPRGIEVVSLAEDLFDALTDAVAPKGVIAVAKKPRRGTDMRGDALLVFDRLQDPGNVGTIIRAADAMGFDGVLCVKGTADPFSPKVVRAAAGALFRIPVYECEGPDEALARLRAGGYLIAALDVRGEALCWDVDLTGRVAFVVGNEGGGVDARFIDSSDITVRAPMTEGTESLNVAVAAGMAMYERRRQIDAGGERATAG